MITLTTEQAQQIEEALVTARCGAAVDILRAARAQKPLMSYKEKSAIVNKILGDSNASKDDKQLAEWLMRCPQTGAKLRFAGAPENDFGCFSRVRLQDSEGNDWTLTAGLQEGWLTEEQRAANFATAVAEEAEAARTQKQEPVGEVDNDSVCFIKWLKFVPPEGTKLYAAPIRTKDLTDFEIAKALVYRTIGWAANARAVIAADRKLNGVEK